MEDSINARGIDGATRRLLDDIGHHRIVDLTRLIEPGIPTYPTHPKYFQMRWCSMGDPAEMNQLVLGEHTGTHLDAPSHFVPEGPRRKHIHELPLELVHGAVREYEVRTVCKDERYGVRHGRAQLGAR